MNNHRTITETVETETLALIEPTTWRNSTREQRQAEAAQRNARMFGTDPSWYGQ
jgi:hypothetical protein